MIQWLRHVKTFELRIMRTVCYIAMLKEGLTMIRDYRREHISFILIINNAFKEAAKICHYTLEENDKICRYKLFDDPSIERL